MEMVVIFPVGVQETALRQAKKAAQIHILALAMVLEMGSRGVILLLFVKLAGFGGCYATRCFRAVRLRTR